MFTSLAPPHLLLWPSQPAHLPASCSRSWPPHSKPPKRLMFVPCWFVFERPALLIHRIGWLDPSAVYWATQKPHVTRARCIIRRFNGLDCSRVAEKGRHARTIAAKPPPPPVVSRRVFRVSFLCSDSSAGHRRIYVPPAVKRGRRMVTRAAAAVQQFSALLEASRKPRPVRGFVPVPGLFQHGGAQSSAGCFGEPAAGGRGDRAARAGAAFARSPELQMEIVVFPPPSMGAKTAPGKAEDVT